MVGIAVDLDDDPLGRPDGVDLVRADPHVGPGLRQLGGADEGEQPPLGLRARQRRLERQRRPDGRRAPHPGSAPSELVGGDQAPDLRLLDRPFQLARRGHRGEVEQRAQRRCDRDALARGDVGRREVGCRVDPDPVRGSHAAPREHDVHARVGQRPQLPQPRRRTNTHRCARPGCQHRCHLPREWRADRTDDEHPTMQPPQPPHPHPMRDRVPGQARIEELVARDHPALTGGRRQPATNRLFLSTAPDPPAMLHLCRSQRRFPSTETAIGPMLSKCRSGHARTLAHTPTGTPSLLPFLTQPAQSRHEPALATTCASAGRPRCGPVRC